MPPLPGLTPNGRRVIVLRGKDKDVDTPNIADIMKVVLMIGDLRLEDEDTGVAGDVYILDASVATTNHFTKITPTAVKKFLVCVQVRIEVMISIIPLFKKLMLFFLSCYFFSRKLIQ